MQGVRSVRSVERGDTMLQQIGVTEARGKFGELVDMVRYPGDTVVLIKSGKPAAAIVPYEWVARYQAERAAAFQVVADVRSQNEGIAESEAELQKLIHESIQEDSR
jgi:prevent-host-death family protein